MEEITIYVYSNGEERALQIPLGINMSLMEALKAYDEPIEATCGGMALCATCQIEILDGAIDKTGEKTDDEMTMLESLPEFNSASRLSCQIKVSKELDGLRILYLQPVLV
ncbi:MAG: 2Fe-2S iron-sulfur cluster binding domain-containing protein [Bacteroidetes bacterium]|nr:2Fe-2S iron-sulfur cluster binding domain-containing protein [Bacteroidota bacterium]